MRRSLLKLRFFVFGCIIVFVFLNPLFVWSAPVVLKYATHLPAHDPITQAHVDGLNFIEKKSEGRVRFEKFFDATLIGMRDSWEELLKGTCDVYGLSAHTSPGEKHFQLHLTLGYGWIGIRDMGLQLKIQRQLIQEFPELRAEWSKVKTLSFHGVPEFNLHTKKEVKKLSDLRGMQIRWIGAWPKYSFEKLGAALVAVPFTEVYIALQKTIITGLLHPDSSLLTYKLAEVTPYTLYLGGIMPGVNEVLCVNLNTWNNLPSDIQKIFEEAIPYIENKYFEVRNEELRKGLDFAKQKNHVWLSLTPSELSELHKILREEGLIKAREVDGKGLPGTKIFNRQQELVRAGR